jgi:hypothetical protein
MNLQDLAGEGTGNGWIQGTLELDMSGGIQGTLQLNSSATRTGGQGTPGMEGFKGHLT